MISKKKILTLDEFTHLQLTRIPHASGELSCLLRAIGLAAKRIHAEVTRAGLKDRLGYTGNLNIHGENVNKMDVFANRQFMQVLKNSGHCAGITSEETDDFLAFRDEKSKSSKYVVMYDPLDGSSNIDLNLSTGSIFGIYRRKTPPGSTCTLADFLQPGLCQVAAGYVMFGTATLLVYATRRGVQGFTLDPSIGEFCLSNPDMQCPASGNRYLVNLGYYNQYDTPTQRLISGFQESNSGNENLYTQRYAGAMVADLHSILLKGGLFMYPSTRNKPQGKLRLQYECNPFAFIMEVAGGIATSGTQRILAIEPATIHQRTPLYIGSKTMMGELENRLQQ